MRTFLLACTAIALCACEIHQTQAQSATSSLASSPPPAPAIPEQGDPVPTAGQPAGPAASLANLTGKLVYDRGGHPIGVVISTGKGKEGEQFAVVQMEKAPRLMGKYLVFPVSSLVLKNSRGYITSLSLSQIKRLPETPNPSP